MLSKVSIQSLYVPALAEGEGVGTAYEYFAKRLILSPWLRKQAPSKNILIAGLPEKYGCSLDFLLLAQELGAAVTVVDDREAALDKLQDSLQAVQQLGWLKNLNLTLHHLPNMTILSESSENFDLGLSSEVLQRIPKSDQKHYLQDLVGMTATAAVFCPSSDNPAHTEISKLAGLRLVELKALLVTLPHKIEQTTGYVDMPPFPPGITRSDEQREQATSGILERIAMWGLMGYAWLERLMPAFIRQNKSHIVYALIQKSQK